MMMTGSNTALHAAHRVGVVHRDLKPADVLLDEESNGYLADSGIAKNLSDPQMADVTQAGAILGMLAMMVLCGDSRQWTTTGT